MNKPRIPNVFDEVEAYLQSETRRAQDRHYASSIVQCPRRAWFGLKGVEKTHTISLAGYLKMKLGDSIGDLWASLLDQTAVSSYPQEQSLLDKLETLCPTMRQDIEDATHRTERPYNVDKWLTHHTAAEVPARIQIPGCDMEVGMRVDNVFTVQNMVMMGETKSSHSTRTRMLLSGWIPLSYLLQAGIYKYRYKELPTEIHYIDRQSCYPYKFGFDIVDDQMVLQPGGYGKKGILVSRWLNGMPLIEFIGERLRWMEELLKQNDPPGRFVADIVPAPRDPKKEFLVGHITGFEDHPMWLDDDDYHLLTYKDGEPIKKKKQANKISYSPGFCPYCAWRGICLEEINTPMIEEEDKPPVWEHNFK